MNDAAPIKFNQNTSPEQRLKLAQEQINNIVVGKSSVIQLALTCMIANGHLLLEDLPGVGKTTLAHALAISAGLNYQRIQFTSDMLPADILGVSVFSRKEDRFNFMPGPIFSQIILADEVNRGTPKTQSALLEAMAERQVTVEGKTRDLPQPFFVIATQNPVDLAGTFPLPDSQLDRFLMKLSLGYPDPKAERQMLLGPDRQTMLEQAQQILDPSSLLELRQKAQNIHVSEAFLDYLQAIVSNSRNFEQITAGLSPRAALSLLAACRAKALLHDRDHCIPEDLQSVFVSVSAHRLHLAPGAELSAAELAERLIKQTPIP